MALPNGVTWVTNIKGETGSIASASAESLPSTSEASVEMSGVGDHRHAHFGVPRGTDGKDGANVLPTAAAIAQEIRDPGSEASQTLDEKIKYLGLLKL